ncbi:hypothetical protein BC833DRAFT_609054 [Globomyces pollinis-pini]|nr:hypothetical protein BC833DRAFT_609054 [Globomyces pollinis-pini]
MFAFLSIFTILTAAHNICMYSCIMQTSQLVGCPQNCQTKYYYNTFYPYVEQADCNTGANGLSKDKSAAYHSIDMGNQNVGNSKVYGRFRNDMQWGETHLIQFTHKSYEQANKGESFGYLSAGGQNSNCRKVTDYVGIDAGFGWSQTCFKVGQCNNGF